LLRDPPKEAERHRTIEETLKHLEGIVSIRETKPKGAASKKSGSGRIAGV
jgi:hypothetical protein